MVEIIVEYKITNNGSETTNHFRLRVLPEVVNDGTFTADDGTTITSGIYATEIDNIEGLTINQDGIEFDPTDSAYNSLSAGDVQEIDIAYE